MNPHAQWTPSQSHHGDEFRDPLVDHVDEVLRPAQDQRNEVSRPALVV